MMMVGPCTVTLYLRSEEEEENKEKNTRKKKKKGEERGGWHEGGLCATAEACFDSDASMWGRIFIHIHICIYIYIHFIYLQVYVNK